MDAPSNLEHKSIQTMFTPMTSISFNHPIVIQDEFIALEGLNRYQTEAFEQSQLNQSQLISGQSSA